MVSFPAPTGSVGKTLISTLELDLFFDISRVQGSTRSHCYCSLPGTRQWHLQIAATLTWTRAISSCLNKIFGSGFGAHHRVKQFCIRNSSPTMSTRPLIRHRMASFCFKAIRALQILLLVSQIITSPDAIAQESKPETDDRSSENNPDTQAFPDRAANTETKDALCLMIESAAKAPNLPVEFFVHVIWQETTFNRVLSDRRHARANALWGLPSSCRERQKNGDCLIPSIPFLPSQKQQIFWPSCVASLATSGLPPRPTMPDHGAYRSGSQATVACRPRPKTMSRRLLDAD